MTFDTKRAATSWLSKQRVEIEEKRTRPEVAATKTTLDTYATEWLKTRRSKDGGPLRPSTLKSYRSHLDTHIRPVLGSMPLPMITPDVIRTWYAGLPDDSPTSKARTYALLRTILKTAVQDDLAEVNPANIRGAGSTKPKKKVKVATPAQVQALADALPAYQSLVVHLGAWCAVRAGEALELRRKDVTTDGASIRIERAVTWAEGKMHIGDPKTDAGKRTIAVPPHVVPLVVAHLSKWVNKDDEALIFPTAPGSFRHTTLSALDHRIRAAVKRTDLAEGFTYHHLRHTGLTYAARAGATVAELMSRAGHSTPGMALKYQHAASERDTSLADAMSKMLNNGGA
jgi:integrase